MARISELVGEQIRCYRTKQNLSQEALAFQAEINVTFLGQVERGVKKPTIETLDKILAALNVSFEDFFSFKSEVTIEAEQPQKIGTNSAAHIEKINTYLAKASDSELQLIYGIVKQIVNYDKKLKK